MAVVRTLSSQMSGTPRSGNQMNTSDKLPQVVRISFLRRSTDEPNNMNIPEFLARNLTGNKC
jgi:hypothetical protein